MAHEDLEEELEHSSNPGILARLATITVLVLLAVAAYLYLNADSSKDTGTLPLITENHRPEKVKPDNPGGMDIPNQDASVYDHLDKTAAAAAEPEKLMPNAEAPMDMGATTPPSSPANIPDVLPGLPAAPPADKPVEAAAPPAATATATAPAPAPANDLAAIVQQAASPAATAPVDDAAARLQLGSVGSQAAADAEWSRVKAKYADELKGLDSHFTEVNLADKGTFVRIQTDAISEADATARCQKLKLTGQACLVVKATP